MKLYTEQEVRKLLNEILMLSSSVEDAINSLSPIKLPSDEEISEVAMVVYGFNAKNIKDVLEYKAFKRGAKWMRNKIQGETYLKCTCSNSLEYSNCSKKCERIIDEQGGKK